MLTPHVIPARHAGAKCDGCSENKQTAVSRSQTGRRGLGESSGKESKAGTGSGSWPAFTRNLLLHNTQTCDNVIVMDLFKNIVLNETKQEFRSCVKVEVDVLGSPSAIVLYSLFGPTATLILNLNMKHS